MAKWVVLVVLLALAALYFVGCAEPPPCGLISVNSTVHCAEGNRG